MTDRRPIFVDTTTGQLTETSSSDTIDLATMPWLERLILDVARCKAAFAFMDVDVDAFDDGLVLEGVG